MSICDKYGDIYDGRGGYTHRDNQNCRWCNKDSSSVINHTFIRVTGYAKNNRETVKKKDVICCYECENLIKENIKRSGVKL